MARGGDWGPAGLQAGPNISFEEFLAPYAPARPPRRARPPRPAPEPFTRLPFRMLSAFANFSTRPNPSLIQDPRPRNNFYLLEGGALMPGRSLFGPSFVVAREFQWCLTTEAQWVVALTPVRDRLPPEPGSLAAVGKPHFYPWGTLLP